MAAWLLRWQSRCRCSAARDEQGCRVGAAQSLMLEGHSPQACLLVASPSRDMFHPCLPTSNL